MLMLDLQDENPACVQATGAQDEMSQVKIQKIKYRPEKVDSYREALNHLLHPVFISPEHDCCLPQFCNHALPRLQLLSLGALASMPVLNCNKVGMTKSAKWHVHQ